MNGKPGNSILVHPLTVGLNLDPDTLKGSYYANPIIDFPDVSPELREQYGEYYRSNICV